VRIMIFVDTTDSSGRRTWWRIRIFAAMVVACTIATLRFTGLL